MTIPAKELIECAVAAPSGHNSQPWLFSVDDNVVRIYPDFRRRLPQADPGDRELFISLGAALENLCIAAAHFGYSASVGYFPPDEPAGCLRVSLTPDARSIDDMFDQIPKRHCNRTIYNYKAIHEKSDAALKNIEPQPGTAYFIYEDERPIEIIKRLVCRAGMLQMKNKAFRRELIGWMRFNIHSKTEFLDGLSYETMNLPAMPDWLGSFLVKLSMTATGQCRRDETRINSSAALILIASGDDDKSAWVAAGRTLESILLRLTSLGIDAAFINAPCQAMPLRDELSEKLALGGLWPQVILRIGYGGEVGRSPRREIGEVLVD